MILTYDHLLVASFITWADNLLCTKGQAYKNQSSLLYPIKSDRQASKFVYASPFKPWVCDNSLSGVNIPSGVWDSQGNFLTRASGISINYEQGQIFSSVPLNAPLSGNFAVKDFNLMYTNEEEDDFIYQTKFVTKSKTNIQPTGIPDDTLTIPVIAFKYNPGQNEPWEFGGTQKTNSQFRLLVISGDSYLLDGALSIFRDSSKSIFYLLDNDQLPYNSLGDYKNGVPFNYFNVIGTDPRRYIYIDQVNILKLSEATSVNVNQKAYVAMVDFKVFQPRNLNNTWQPSSNPDFRVSQDGSFRITE